MARPPWDKYFLDIAKAVSARASCPRASVGAVLVRNNRIIATGYNGAPARTPSCDEIGCNLVNGHCKRARHAEQNALYYCEIYDMFATNSTAYITLSPCLSCAQYLRDEGVSRVVYSERYPTGEDGVSFLEENGIKVDWIIPND